MRTKTLLLTAACAVAGSVAVSAQSVYSVNAVGYVNVSCPVGFSMIANPLNAPTNTISQLLGVPPDLTAVYEWVNGNFAIGVFYSDGPGTGTGSWDNDLPLAPGTGAWIFNTGTTPYKITFVGEVDQNTQTVPITTGFNLVGSKIPQSGALDSTLGYVPNDLDAVYQYQNGNYAIGVWYADGPGLTTGSWDNVPQVGVGEGFWVYTTTAKSWTRTFNINN
jgi:hypothetical protein